MDATEAWPPPDPVGEALHFLRMDGAFYCRSELRAPWGMTLHPMPGYLWFHVVTTGGTLLEVDQEHARWLHPGDVALGSRGNGHVLRSEPGVSALGILELELEHPSDRYEILRHGGGAPTTPPRPPGPRAPPWPSCPAGSATSPRPRSRAPSNASSASPPAPPDAAANRGWTREETLMPRVRSDAIACTTDQHLLGEGARWDARRGELLRVDILDGRVYRDQVADDGALLPVGTYQVPGTVGAVAPVQDDPGWLLAAGRGFAYLSVDGSLRRLAEVTPAGTRMNDAACDPQGRFWAGTKADHAGGAALYRLDGNGQTELMLDGLTISNGLGWSPDGGTMYLADTIPGVIHAFAFDAERGMISDGRVLIEVAEEVGAPDGLTVDADGDLWVAIWGGGRVHRYSPDGVLREALLVPAAQSTSCAFAGPGLHWLYVTTATEDWSDEQRRAEPTAGLTYRFDTDVAGRPAAPFHPDPTWWATVIS
jgi:sugar lactone lactonase YvrE